MLAFLAVALGSGINPLINLFPFSNLDVSRFLLYALPFLATLVGLLLEQVLRFIDSVPVLKRRWLAGAIVVVLLAEMFALPVRDALHARQLAAPYKIEQDVQQAMNWLTQTVSPLQEASQTERVFATGFWTRSNFLAPYVAERPLAEGWADEGASSWRTVRQLRQMGWSNQVDPDTAHMLLRQMGVQTVLIDNWYAPEHPASWLQALRSKPGLFHEEASWGKVVAFRVR